MSTTPTTDAPRRLLFVHAHPDDESSKGSATAARYADTGARVTLVTCTGGERGDVLNAAMAHVTGDELTSVRALELVEAVRIIGFHATYSLREVDSGWHEDLGAVPLDGCFWHAPLDRPAERLASILRHERPQVVVTYPPDGGYPHPDHIRTHDVTMRAVELAASATAPVEGEPWQVARVLGVSAFTRPYLEACHAAMLERGLESPYQRWLHPEDGEQRPERDADVMPVAARVDVSAWFDRRDDALRAHATQVDPDGAWFAMPREVLAEVWPWEQFVALRPAEVDGPPLDDLFAGLDA